MIAYLQQDRLPAMLREAEQSRSAGQVYRVIDGATKLLFLARKWLDAYGKEQEVRDAELADAVVSAAMAVAQDN
ncbi:outer membrane [Chlorella sorokiniana]|uniref:Outer membrane n=1 Tax=Chlorella sorokiniana TaxID=3076 RepID=A0A2P6TLD6_CHLSO|nr:outer membrane [Chlorella sorokiniana]|eukprot:PRW45101.1 outer membrane [Chlorella sorokiniana]